MSITELPDEPESTDAPVLDDEALDSLAPAIPAADVEDLRSRVHGPVHAAGDDGLAAEVATWNLAVTHTPAIAVGATCAANLSAPGTSPAPPPPATSCGAPRAPACPAPVPGAARHGRKAAGQATGPGPVHNAPGSVLAPPRRMQEVSIDRMRGTARIQAGV